MKLLIRTLAICCLFVFIKAEIVLDPICDTPLNIPTFNEEECIFGNWYQYASSEQCDYCCISRTLTIVQPGVLNVTEIINTQKSQPIIYNFIVRKFNADLDYSIDSNPGSILITSVHCENYVVLRKLRKDKIEIFVRDVKFIPEIQKVHDCGMKLYRNNPEVSCLEFL